METAVRAAIVEDSAADRALMAKYLRRYEREKGLRFELTEFQDGEDLVTDYTADYDLILLDIRMTFMDGMQAARRVREMDEDVVILFITVVPQYAIEGYKVRAADYILKPFSWQDFSDSLDRALRLARPQGRDTVTIALKGGRMKLEADSICYVEAQDHLLVYNTLNGSYTAKGTMKEAEKQLGADRFFRCNRCYLVNLSHVEVYQGSDIHVNGDVIQVSRRRKKSFMDALNLYLNGADR